MTGTPRCSRHPVLTHPQRRTAGSPTRFHFVSVVRWPTEQLRTPRQARSDIAKLRAALEQRAEEWKATLRAEPKVARLLLRRLIGPR